MSYPGRDAFKTSEVNKISDVMCVTIGLVKSVKTPEGEDDGPEHWLMLVDRGYLKCVDWGGWLRTRQDGGTLSQG